uniref:Ig-like domain-containing protein n=1 Tax=Oncorhynchus tshawytscha TaxID=74940 RepID=A0A8C8MM54_ONCTS
MFLTSLLLLAVLPYIHSISLTSSPAQLKPPGESVKLSCQVSGYVLTDYGTGWIRQQPGKTLEWIGIIWGGGSINSGASFKSRFTISRDSSNVLYLDITSLQAEDTAVYYCAKTGGTVQQLNGRPGQKHLTY